MFAAQVQSGDLVELPLPLSIEWKSALLVKRETYTTPLARHMVGLFESVAKGQQVAGLTRAWRALSDDRSAPALTAAIMLSTLLKSVMSVPSVSVFVL